jgi:hypothetical protein
MDPLSSETGFQKMPEMLGEEPATVLADEFDTLQEPLLVQ